MINFGPPPEDRRRRMAQAVLAAESGGTPATSEDIASRQRMAQSLIQEGSSGAPVGHWTQALNRGLQGLSGGMMQAQASSDATARAAYDEQQSTAKRMAERLAAMDDKKHMTEWERSLPPTAGDQLDMDYRRAQIAKMQRDQAQAAENAERQKAFYNTFISPQTTSSTPVSMSSGPGSPDAARFAAPALAASAPATPQTPQEIFNALPPNRKAQAQMALASGDMDEFRKILGEGPPQLADNLTPGEKRVDQAFAKSYEDFVLSGSAADFDKNLKQVRGVHGELTDPKGANLTGPVLGRMPDFVTAYTNPEAVDARQRIEEVVQRNLRIILGAQFTQKEGENLIARAYNPALDEATNAKRLERLITSMEKMKEAKLKAMDYFERNGTIKGFRGTTQFSVDSILADLDTPEQRDTSGGSSGFKYIGTDD